MCTLLTINKEFYNKNRADIVNLIYSDNLRNADGLSLLCVGDNFESDLLIKTFNCNIIIDAIDSFFDNNDDGRIFLHQRAATTGHVGISYCHGFDNRRGVYYMHNGIIGNDAKKAVDSFNLINMPSNITGLFHRLKNLKESFANIFIIDTESEQYGVIRMSNGNLHTDKNGNYSTHEVGEIKFRVSTNYYKNFDLKRKHMDLYNYMDADDLEYDWDKYDRYQSYKDYEHMRTIYLKKG